MEGGTFQSRKLARASADDYVFVFLHQTEEDSVASYKLVTEEYLEEEFLHPAYFFLRPDGTEADPKNRHHHEAVSAQLILKILDGIQKEWGRSLSPKEYAAAKRRMEEAEKLFVAGETEKARAILTGLTKLRARCGIRERAKAMLSEMEVRERLLAAWAGLSEISADLRTEVAHRLRNGRTVDALRYLRKNGGETTKAFQEALADALRELIRLRPLRMDKVYAQSRAYYYLRGEWETRLVPFDGLVLTLAYLAEGGKTFEGFATYDHVKPSRHHRAATSLSSRDLRLKNLVNARLQLWIDDFLLAERLWKPDGPKVFPAETSHVIVGPDLLREEESLGVSVHSNLREYEVGRYPPAK